MIGLSGLITPSLDEMVTVAKEMERLDISLPLMIGGATTSKVHTALKIEPQFKKDQVVYVQDASRAVGVAQNLLSPENKSDYVGEVQNEYEKIRVERAKHTKVIRTYDIGVCRDNALAIDWQKFTADVPTFLGLKTFDDYDLSKLVDRIDWTPFFSAWELAGKFPRILDDEVVGEEAQKLYADAQKMLEKIVDEQWLEARGVIGFFPANAVGDDIEVYADESRDDVVHVLHNLRQQDQKRNGKPNYCLSDFIAPKDSGKADYIGGFAVTTGHKIEEKLKEFEAEHDDYQSIMLKVLADRLAEAFAEHMHERVRKEFWAYEPEESLDNEDLIKEKYRGIRPAPGYPACPDHTEKATLWKMLEPDENAGVSITESFAMLPTAAVSGWYFAHPESRYFPVVRIQKDQIEDYAERKGQDLMTTERWMQSVLGYDV